MAKLNVLVVDDSVIYRRILYDAVEATGIAEVKNSASNGKIALEILQNETYDVVILDINMPELDGLETLKRIKNYWPDLSVIMITTKVGGNVEVCESMKRGAMDFVLKPLKENCNGSIVILQNTLLPIFQQISMKRCNTDVVSDVASMDITQSSVVIQNRESIHKDNNKRKLPNTNYKLNENINLKRANVNNLGVDLLVVAASTGGPSALKKLFSNIKENISVPLLVVQHMPIGFTKVLAQSLDKKTNIRFREGKEGDMLKPGEGIIAPGGHHMLICGDGTNKMVSLSKSEYVNGVRPAADVLFKSVAQEYKGASILAVVLTGMGCDGLAGIRELKEKCSCYCITQAENNCIVYGMPRCVFEAGLSDEVLDVDNIAARIQYIVNGRS